MKRTLFIVGAGASCDFRLPIGTDLARNIGALARDAQEQGPANMLMRSAMASQIHGDYGEAARQVAGGMIAAPSIDRFLHSREGNDIVQVLGKYGIAAALLEAERNSLLATLDDTDWNQVHAALISSGGTWLARLFKLLHVGVRPDDAHTIFENCAFLTFNYDRCIERYLEFAFAQIMGRNGQQVKELIDQIPILHVYGSLGTTPLQNPAVHTPFGANLDFIAHAAQSLRTFMEGVSEGIGEAIEKQVRGAEVIIFLGFGFDQMNVNLLFSRPLREDQTVRGTQLGASPVSIEYFTSKAQPHPTMWQLAPAECSVIMQDPYLPRIMGL